MLSLSWDAHQENICSGLSLLQQRGEFVDMTLAADGHHVKVHQMVVSLASPYIKALISSAQCPHPVIFLNNVSYTTLCSILEYVYTGEVNIHKEKLKDLIAAGKALHIKGLREMNDTTQFDPENDEITTSMQDIQKIKLKVPKENKKDNVTHDEIKADNKQMCEVFLESLSDECVEEMENESSDVLNTTPVKPDDEKMNTSTDEHSYQNMNKEYCNPADVQYSMSNQGNLQLIVNRYMYNLKYVKKNLNKYWRCVDYACKKCPANVYTNNENVVLKRRCTHNHPFHDAKILKKVHHNIVFKCYKEAKERAEQKRSTEIVLHTPLPTKFAD